MTRNKVCGNSGDKDPEVPVDHPLNVRQAATIVNNYLAVQSGRRLVKVSTTHRGCIPGVEWAASSASASSCDAVVTVPGNASFSPCGPSRTR